jgi:competence protein ComEC
MRVPGDADDAGPRPRDLRALLLGLAAWAGVLAELRLPAGYGPALLAVGGLTAAVLGARSRRAAADRTSAGVTVVACVLVAVVAAVVTAMRADANGSGAVAGLAREGAAVTASGRVVSDPVVRSGRFGSYSLTRMTITELDGRGRHVATRAPVLVVADDEWRAVALGSRVRVTGRLGPSAGPDLAAVLATGRAPVVLTRPGVVFDGAARVRSGIRRSVADVAPDPRALVPALVVGDDSSLSAPVVEDFRTCGLTHLSAVSGTNLTLVVGFLLVLARWAGVRARGLVLAGAFGVLGFVVLARPEPSVLRAAAMGSVALLGLGSRGPDQGVRALGVALLVLLLADPWLAVSAGFILSALATVGILLVAPPIRDALVGWLPRWAAEALAVPFAAQLACTPVVAAISGQVSLVAVLANLVVAVVVGPATVLGLVGGLLVLVVPPLGAACGWAAGLCASWIILVATRMARLPTAAVEWSPGGLSIALLTLLCVWLAFAAPWVLRRPGWSGALSILLLVVMLRPLPSPGWPPAGWVLVACDVGQGDGLVLSAGPRTAVVVDTGPEPEPMGRCLDRLGVRRVPLVVLTHFHADHVDGLPAVLADHRVGELDVTGLGEPASGADRVRRWAAAARVPVRVPAYGEVRRVGAVTWQVVGPVRAVSTGEHGEEGSVANNASLVLVVQTRGIRMLLAGDMEPEAQQRLERSLPRLRVDVLKVPHHGSRYQDPGLLTGLGARLGVISVGRDNDYGHPSAVTVRMLRGAGMAVDRTDRDGDVAVTVRDGVLGVRARGSRAAR